MPSAGPGADRAVEVRLRLVPGTRGSRVQIAVGPPAEHRLGEQHLKAALEMTELFGRVTAVPTFRQMFPHIGQEISTPANRDIQETVVETAFTGRREFPVGTHASGTELLAGLVQSGRGTGRVDTQQAYSVQKCFPPRPRHATAGIERPPEEPGMRARRAVAFRG